MSCCCCSTKSRIIAAAWGFRKLSVKEYFKSVNKLGICGLEMHIDAKETKNSLDSTNPVEEAKKAKELSEKYCVSISSIAIGNDFTLNNDDDINRQIENVKRAIDLADMLDSRIIRIFAGFIEKSKITDSTYKKVWDSLNNVGKYAEKKNITLCIENHGGITANGDDCLKVLKGIKSKAVAINFDPANFYFYGEDPLKGLRKVAKYIKYAHWKDVKKVNDKNEYCAFGEGIIDWTPIIKELGKIGYNGYYSIEYETFEDVERGTLASLNKLKELGVK
ncbi:MAG TPA: hypothetical protein DCP53_08080 [Elusimicrobia bacterium]|nr:hypothetical protein [Elusimicrobiota bacterium]